MRSFLLLAILSTVLFVSLSACGATWYVDASVPSSGDGTTWETAFKTIQKGIDAASHWHTVTVAKGVYVEKIRFNGKNIVLTSTDALDLSVVAATIIDGNKAGSVVTFNGTETEACVLSGFTIQNGTGTWGERETVGGGICGGTDTHHTHAAIENNTITGNSAGWGGGLAGCHGTIQSNTITGNSAGSGSGGLYYCDGTIQNNTITGNWARFGGGGLSYCSGTIQNNAIAGNSSERDGGGLYCCSGTIRNNAIRGNLATYSGGGLYECHGTVQSNTISSNTASSYGAGLVFCNGTIQNNTITGNSGGRYGGGLAFCDGIIQNNTIAGNWADSGGGGLDHCAGTIRNSVIWANTAPVGPQLQESSIPTYSCIQDWSGVGEGKIASDPLFLDPNAGDYRLQASSPCIDGGYNDPSLPATDIAGMHRIMYGGKSLTVDMGAYEFHIWPPTENVRTGEMTLKWSSLAGRIYTVYYCGDMFTWDVLADDVPSAGDTVTTWIDPPAPILPPGVRIRHYKVAENPPVTPPGQ